MWCIGLGRWKRVCGGRILQWLRSSWVHKLVARQNANKLLFLILTADYYLPLPSCKTQIWINDLTCRASLRKLASAHCCHETAVVSVTRNFHEAQQLDSSLPRLSHQQCLTWPVPSLLPGRLSFLGFQKSRFLGAPPSLSKALLTFLSWSLHILPTSGGWTHAHAWAWSHRVRTLSPIATLMTCNFPVQSHPELHTFLTSPMDMQQASWTDTPKDVEKSEPASPAGWSAHWLGRLKTVWLPLKWLNIEIHMTQQFHSLVHTQEKWKLCPHKNSQMKVLSKI